MSSLITVLDEDTVNKIAAGEVVERPSSVVKELVENSLDAEATRIEIELLEGGKHLVRVTDNGIGMSRKDAELALRRHATSKIRCANDLLSIRTLGFRGEALPSIASVSRLELVTRKLGEECGTKIVCAGGELIEIEDIGAPVGTSVSVSDLFSNVPARQKFLKSSQTELSHVVELVNRFAISHSHVDIILVHNKRVIFQSGGFGRLEDAVLVVFGRDAAENIIPICAESGSYRIWGVVSRPTYSKTNRSGQMFFVNRRYVRSRSLTHALDEAYRGILPQGRFPLFVGFTDIEPGLVDVNVHPTKIEVKFAREWEIYSLLSSCIREKLSSLSVTPLGFDALQQVVEVRRPSLGKGKRVIGGYKPNRQDISEFRQSLAAKLGQQTDTHGEVISSLPVDSNTTNLTSDPLADAVVLAQARNLYIIAQSSQGLLLIDQHVAHERVLYDRLSGRNAEVLVQQLMIPVTLSLGRKESLVLENKLEDLKGLGFQIEPFGKNSFVLRGVPTFLAEKNYEQIFRDIVDELTELTLAKHLVVHKEALLMTTACKMAIKAGERLSLEEMERLVADLRVTSNPFLCPHGRPVLVCLSNRDLDKMFGRI